MESNNLTLRQMRAFVVVARSRSFVRAAKELCITPSALSDSIRQLESTLHVRLFDRTTRSVELTSAGEEFLSDTSQALRVIDASFVRMGELGSASRGVARIASVPSIHANFTAPVVATLMDSHPLLRFVLLEDEITNIVRLVLEGQVDFGMGVVPADLRQRLEIRPVISDVYGVVARNDHPAFRRQSLQLHALHQWNYIAVALGAEMDKHLAEAGVVPRVHVNGFGAMIALLEEGDGVSVLPALAAFRMLTPKLRFRPFCDSKYEREVSVMTRPGRMLSPAAQLVHERLLSRATSFSLPAAFQC